MIRSLFKVTAWEKAALGRRLLCAFGRVSVLLAILAVIGYSIFAHQYEIEAKVWHWRHGYATTIGIYEIPVSDHWLVLAEESTSLTLANISPVRHQRDGKFHTTTVINVDVYSENAGWKESWVALEQQRLASQEVESVEEKTLKFANEPITCIGGKELSARLRDKPSLPQMDTISLNCMSEGGLNIRFVGEPSDVQSFYTFVSRIRRKS